MTNHETRLNESMRIIRSLGTSFAALVEMRKFAELIVDMIMNDPRVSESLRRSFSRGNLGKSLAIVEDKAPELGIPREIPAALRSLQAYGNYGAHFDPDNERPSKLSVDAAMASVELVFQWIPRWLGAGTGTGGEESNTNQAEPIKLRSSVPSPGFFQKQWIWFLLPDYPPDNISIYKSHGTGEKGSIYRYPSLASPGIKRGVLLAFLTDQMDTIHSIASEVIRLECETPVPREGESIIKAILFISRERPQKVPDFICQDILSLLRMKEVVSRSTEPDEESLDAIALELSRRGFVGDVARWFAENYIRMNLFEIHGARWLAKTFFLATVIASSLAIGKSMSTSDKSRNARTVESAASPAKTCVPCGPPLPSASGESR